MEDMKVPQQVQNKVAGIKFDTPEIPKKQRERKENWVIHGQSGKKKRK